MKKIKKIHIIINPASGRFEPILPTINAALKDSDINWEVSITKNSGDAAKFAKEFSDSADLIAVYGGDGTVMEGINGVMKTKTPLAIFPGGTANVMAAELGIPGNLKEACELLTGDSWELKTIDVGKIDRRHFILRAGMGLEANMVRGANRESKNKWGRLAYVFSAFNAMRKIKMADYTVTVDGKEHKVSGIDCIIANAGSVGFGTLTMDQKIDPSDGKLDVIVLKKFDFSMVQYALRILAKGDPSQDRELVAHFTGEEIHINTAPHQTIICDGETLGKQDDIHAKIIPEAVQIVVPKPKTV